MRRHLAFLAMLGLFVGVAVWVTVFVEQDGVMTPFTWSEMADFTLDHIKMVAVSEAVAIGIGVPLGVLIALPYFRSLSPPVLGVAGVGQSVPSMAVIAMAGPIFLALGLKSFGYWPTVAALIVYGLMPIIRNAYAGIDNIDPAIIEAARGMGMSQRQIIRRIQLPLATRIILAGIRTSTTLLVGTATLGVLIGSGGLGEPILSGIFNYSFLVTLQGAAFTAALAVILDRLLAGVETWFTPRGLLIERE